MKKVTKALKQKMIDIAHANGLKLHFIKRKSYGGMYDDTKKLITVSLVTQKGYMLNALNLVSCFCHELGHAAQDKLQTKLTKIVNNRLRPETRYFISKFRLQYEYEADKFGSKFKTWAFPEIKGEYLSGYPIENKKETIEYLLKHYEGR
jgi:hypothetical protein